MNSRKLLLTLWTLLAVCLYLLLLEFESRTGVKLGVPVLSLSMLRFVALHGTWIRVAVLLIPALMMLLREGGFVLRFDLLAFVSLLLLIPVAILFAGSVRLGTGHYRLMMPLFAAVLPALFFGTTRFFGRGRRASDHFGIKNPVRLESGEHSFNWKTDAGYINVVNPFQGILIVGGAGSGKTYSVIQEIIYQAARKKYTGFIYDYKNPELLEIVRQAVAESEFPERKLFHVDFKNVFASCRINPLSPSNLILPAFAGEYSATVLKNLKKEWVGKQDFWADNAIAYLKAIIWYLRQHHPDCCTLPHAISVAVRDYPSVLGMLEKDRDCRMIVASMLTAFRENASAQIAGCVSSLQTPMDRLNDPGIFWVLSGNDCNLDLNALDSPAFLVAGSNPLMSESLGPAISLVATVIMKKLNQKNRHKSVFLLDEAPTLYIPGLKDLPNTGRSNLISTVYCCQDYSQMELMYGRDESRALRASLGNQFIGMVNDASTAEQVSRIFGKSEKQSESQNLSRSSPPGFFSDASYSRGSSWQMHERELIKASEILTLPCGHFVGKTTSASRPFFHAQIQVPGRSSTSQAGEVYDDKRAVQVGDRLLTAGRLIDLNFRRIHEEAEDIITEALAVKQ